MHKERLLQLADHLENGKLGHQQFNFATYNDAQEPVCGTSGCAIGECPILWPQDWGWGEKGKPKMLSHVGLSAKACGMMWFSLDGAEYEHLFLPAEQIPKKYGGEKLTAVAHKEQVAANIREFVRIKESNQGEGDERSVATGDQSE